MTRVLITGAGGFIGENLCGALKERDFEVIPVFRGHQVGPKTDPRNAVFGKVINGSTDWAEELGGVDVLVHLAARAHITRAESADDLAKFREINVEGTINLARKASQSGVKRFVFLSSIKVNGERTDQTPFSVDQRPDPEDAYGISKLEAEIALREIERETGMDVVIIRPPLVYGPGVKGNLRALVSMIKSRMPMPFGAVDNRRDLISIYNLCDLVSVCILHPAASGGTFLVSDNEAISTADLIRHIAKGLGRRAWLLPVPVWALKTAAGIVGKRSDIEKLTGDLRVDITKTRQTLDWKPALSVAESFRRMFTEG